MYGILITFMQFKMWLYFLGEAIFLATLIVKNWRIYCIFNNKSLKMIVSHTCILKAVHMTIF